MSTDIIRVDGVAIDAETGEILDLDKDIPGRVEWIAMQLAKAKANVKGWTQVETLLKQECERLMVAAGAKSVRTPYGTPTLMLGRETVDVEATKAAIAASDEEIECLDHSGLVTDAMKELAIYRACTNGFNARAVKDWLAPDIGLEAVDALIRRGRDYIQLNPPREEAPRVRQKEVAQ